jgi:DNA-binding NarL/FixJ family response regulator
MAERIRVSVLSDSRLFREALAVRFTLDPQIELAAAANNVHGLLTQLQGLPVESLLVHADMESLSEAMVWEIKSLLPAARIIVLESRETPGWNDGLAFPEHDGETLRWIEAGAQACVPCSASYASLRETICAVAAGFPPCSREMLLGAAQRIPTMSEAAGPKETRKSLSFRGAEIACLVERGALDSKEIAKRLRPRSATVDSQFKSVLRKLDLRRRADLLDDDSWRVG